ncbi:hypothetical protein GMOD_00004275 [Pyrenophora seminiperda CCB06]|uniref:Secreted protein n=1 Tax=Pyrenophora seminiperda CCB06 TaxID=1302712 RepID=A0A3M7M0R8_9PLEO|nr:hypothetical protein GMOD_00004275 [Pyrenophora seminiperda CCB06]
MQASSKRPPPRWRSFLTVLPLWLRGSEDVLAAIAVDSATASGLPPRSSFRSLSESSCESRSTVSGV